jgi:hypothetical protein
MLKGSIRQAREKQISINAPKHGMISLKIMGQDTRCELVADWNASPVTNIEMTES